VSRRFPSSAFCLRDVFVPRIAFDVARKPRDARASASSARPPGSTATIDIMTRLLALACAVAGLAAAAPVQHVQYSRAVDATTADTATFALGDVRYFASLGEPAAVVASDKADNCLAGKGRLALGPVTVLASNASNIDAAVIGQALDAFADKDDVWSPAFLETTLLVATAPRSTLTAEACAALGDRGAGLLLLGGSIDSSACTALDHEDVELSSGLLQGPYVAARTDADGQIGLYRVYRLYVDTQSGACARSDSKASVDAAQPSSTASTQPPTAAGRPSRSPLARTTSSRYRRACTTSTTRDRWLASEQA
jgi:hypothetical protein